MEFIQQLDATSTIVGIFIGMTLAYLSIFGIAATMVDDNNLNSKLKREVGKDTDKPEWK